MSNHPNYENLRDDDLEDSILTETEDSLMGEEKGVLLDEFRRGHATKSRRIGCLSILKEARWFLDIVLLGFIIILLLNDRSHKLDLSTSEHEVGGDITGVGPHCKQQLGGQVELSQ